MPDSPRLQHITNEDAWWDLFTKLDTADIGTKAVSAEVLRKHVKTLKMKWREGRHPLALRAVL